MMSDNIGSHYFQLSGTWQVYPIPLEQPFTPSAIDGNNTLIVPDAVHLQPILYPHQPYWGEHLRKINEQAWIYHRSFSIPDIPYRRLRLHFAGVDYFAAVWLNGHWLRDHEGHFNPFGFDVTEIIRPNEANSLTVRVIAPWDKLNSNTST